MSTGGRYNRLLENDEYLFLLGRIKELESERKYCRHGIEHLLDTARIMYIIKLEEDLPYSKDIIYAAALLHDIGRYEQYKDGTPHNTAGERTANKLLAECGFNSEEAELICKAISVHRTPADSDDKSLGALLYKADKLSRMCFFCDVKDECYWNEELKNRDITL